MIPNAAMTNPPSGFRPITAAFNVAADFALDVVPETLTAAESEEVAAAVAEDEAAEVTVADEVGFADAALQKESLFC
jgi:2-keto-3-deoxy-L-rhamnonate aldolase RhmA